VLAGDTSAQAWIKTLLQDELPAQAYGRLLLLPGAKAPVAVQSRGKLVCTCFNVSDMAMRTPGAAGSRRRRCRPPDTDEGAAGVAAGNAAMRHQLRLLRARAQAPGALGAQRAAVRRTAHRDPYPAARLSS
jgi:hypothetical protein